MLDFTFRRSIAADAIPRKTTTLSVSWLNNQLKAVAVHRGRVDGTWERPGISDGPGNFEGFIREAVARTNYHGHSVSLVLAHPRLVQQLVDAPPVKGAALQKIIQRHAQQQKVFPGEAVWASQTSPYGKGLQQVILHLFPRQVLNQMAQGCRRCGLDLTSVLPPSAVLHHQMTQLPLDEEEVALLAAETGGSTHLVIGRRDGQILLARTLPGTWNEEPERLALDLNRTILFANQQFGSTIVQGVWLFGPGAEQQCAVVRDHIQFPVTTSPIEYDPFYWATEALKLRPEHAPNFISLAQQKAPQRRVFAKIVGATTIIAAIAALGTSYYFSRQAKQEAANIKKLSQRIVSLQNRRTELQALDNEMARKSQVIRLVQGDRPPPTPAWFLGYLSEALPSDLVVTNFQIKREEDYYKVQIGGMPQQAIKNPSPQSMANALAEFKARLSGAPFHLKILEKLDTNLIPAGAQAPPIVANASENGMPRWLSRVTRSISFTQDKPKPVVEDHFLIEGVIR
jgi:hypothetical protein